MAPERRISLAVAMTPEDEAKAGAGRPAGGHRTVGGSQLLPPGARAPSLIDSTCSGFGPACPSSPTEAGTGLTRLSAQRRVPAGFCPSILTTCDQVCPSTCDLAEEPRTAPHMTVRSEMATVPPEDGAEP